MYKNRAAFYHSRQWQQLSKVFLMSKNYICERCGGPASIAHHKKHLNAANFKNPEIALNPENLEALCIDCHNREHFSSGGAIARGFAFDENGDLVERTESND